MSMLGLQLVSDRREREHRMPVFRQDFQRAWLVIRQLRGPPQKVPPDVGKSAQRG
jgi:hypothetical protein